MMRNKILFGMIAATSMFAASCTDFDDFNTPYEGDVPGSNVSIYDNIASNENLSQFKELLDKSGYGKVLQSPRYYTVWAPLNGKFDYSAFANADSATIVDRFIKNHVANYNYTLSAGIDERVHMLNEKSYSLKGAAGDYTFDGNRIVEANIPSVNGVIHTIDGYSLYRPNTYEYLFEAEDADSVAKYFKRYEYEYLDKEQSVEGEIDQDGNQTYSDSVMVVTNTLLRSFNADMDIEDSSYTVLIPNNEAYEKAYNMIKTHYVTPTKIEYYPITSGPTGAVQNKTSVTIADNEYLCDSLTRLYLTGATIYSNDNGYNQWLKEGAEQPSAPLDTLQTTTRNKATNGLEMLSHTVGEPIKLSNGMARIVDTLAIRSWDHFNYERHVQIFSDKMRPLVKAASPEIVALDYHEQDFSKGGERLYNYLDLKPASDASVPEAFFYLNGILSTTYKVYVVVVPADIKVGSSEKPKQVKFEVSINYANKADGTSSGSIAKPTKVFSTATSDSTCVDTVLVGEITFPVSYVGVGSKDIFPYLSIKSKRSTWNKKEWDTVDNRIRIADIILRPVEYDEYLKGNKTEE